MAVTKAKSVWILTAATDVTEARSFKKVRWVAVGATAGDECILKDSDGNVMFHSTAAVQNFVDSFEFTMKEPLALTVDTLDSGTVYLYE